MPNIASAMERKMRPRPRVASGMNPAIRAKPQQMPNKTANPNPKGVVPPGMAGGARKSMKKNLLRSRALAAGQMRGAGR